MKIHDSTHCRSVWLTVCDSSEGGLPPWWLTSTEQWNTVVVFHGTEWTLSHWVLIYQCRWVTTVRLSPAASVTHCTSLSTLNLWWIILTICVSPDSSVYQQTSQLWRRRYLSWIDFRLVLNWSVASDPTVQLHLVITSSTYELSRDKTSINGG